MSIRNFDGGVNWDPKKKAERDKAREKQKAFARAGQLYESWKTELMARARSRREIIKSLYTMREKFVNERAYLEENGFSVNGTLELIDNHIAGLTAIQVCAQNTIIQHVPTASMASHVDPKMEQFRTVAELEAIPFVKFFADQSGFRGFSAKMVPTKNGMTFDYFLLAHYENDHCLVGRMLNDVCIDDLPSYDDIENKGGESAPVQNN